MLRRILGVLAGYVAMFAAIFITFSTAYRILGPEGSFKPGVYDASATWLIVSFVLGLLAAMLGGWVAARIAGFRAVRMLAIFVLVLGFAIAFSTMSSEVDPGPRAGDVSNMEAMSKAKQPHWVSFVNPIVGAAGVFLGGRRRGATAAVVA